MVLTGNGPPAPCAYCRALAAPGAVFCQGCGMKLPVYRGVPREAPDEVRCPECAGYVRDGTCALCCARVGPSAA
jgi:predicted amidophosphoribosyltransferase